METNGQPEATWFVGANFDTDQTPRFLREGVWENGHNNKFQDLVRSMRPGQRIAIKSAPPRKIYRGLPFDDCGQGVKIMDIKATGTIIENLNNGRRVRVNWTERHTPPRKWYFFSHFAAVWCVRPGEWRADALIAFTFDGQDQDIDRFIETYLSNDTDKDSAVSDDEGNHVNGQQNGKSPSPPISVNVPKFQEILERMEKDT